MEYQVADRDHSTRAIGKGLIIVDNLFDVNPLIGILIPSGAVWAQLGCWFFHQHRVTDNNISLVSKLCLAFLLL